MGSTGSIGRQTLDIAAEYPQLFEVDLLVANRSADLLIEQALRFKPRNVVIASSEHYDKVAQALEGTGIAVHTGDSVVSELVAQPQVDTVVTAMVGYSGLASTIAAIKASKKIALANKETLVVAGELINEMLKSFKESSDKKDKKQREALRFVKSKIDSARWFIDAIKQRNETLMRTMQAILDAQKDFFIEGDVTYLKPLILQDIATQTGYDISTISRVSNSKYVQTEYGIFPLKFFFSESIANSEGEEISTREIKGILKEVINAEDKHHPLTDIQLVEILKLRGYNLARRTVAKYREQLNIPVARLRKKVH